MKTKIVCGVVAGTALLVCAFGSRADDRKTEPLIDSIQGPALYKAYCAVCHGADAKGSQPGTVSLKVKAPDLTRLAARNGGSFSLAHMRGIISGEEMLPHGHGSREMPVWGPILSQVDRDQDLGRVRVDNLARYIESLQVK
jgi:mono/diheme cytochrome c family protein